MSARFYSPGLGTFTQLDSVMGGAQNPLSMNRFLYAGANPATMIDPTGHAYIGGNACSQMADYCPGPNGANSTQNKDVRPDEDYVYVKPKPKPKPKPQDKTPDRPKFWISAKNADPDRTWGRGAWLPPGGRFVEEAYDYPIETRGLCVGGGGASGAGGAATICWVKQPDGTRAMLVTGMFLGETGQSIGAGVSTYSSNAGVLDQGEWFSTSGVSFGPKVLTGGIDYSLGADGVTATQIWLQASKGLTPLEFHSGISWTEIYTGSKFVEAPTSLPWEAYADLSFAIDRLLGTATRIVVPLPYD
jgi:hypothetical protein